MKSHGGKRKGAGRKEEISLMIQMSLMLRVAEIKRGRGFISNSSALRILEKNGELPKQSVNKKNIQNEQYKSYLKYLTPKHLDPKIKKILLETRREGIVSLIPKEIPKYTPKSPKKLSKK